MRLRTRLKETLQQDHPALGAQVPSPVWSLNWVADVQPVGTGEPALKYLAAYVYRTAFSAERIVADDGQLEAVVRTDHGTKGARELGAVGVVDAPRLIDVADDARPAIGRAARELNMPEDCAVMAVNQLRDFLENGNVKNSVNYPDCDMGPAPIGGTRRPMRSTAPSRRPARRRWPASRSRAKSRRHARA